MYYPPVGGSFPHTTSVIPPPKKCPSLEIIDMSLEKTQTMVCLHKNLLLMRLTINVHLAGNYQLGFSKLYITGKLCVGQKLPALP